MAQSRTKTRVVTKAVLKGLVAAGGLGMVLVAPNSAILIDKYLKSLDKRDAARTLRHMKYRKLITVRERGGDYEYKLTDKGRDRYERLVLDELAIKTPASWDGKWRLVVFDIPVGLRKQHDECLRQLKQMKFLMLQHSTWVHPFDCEKEMGVLLHTLKLESYASFIVAETGNFTTHAETHFKRRGLLT